MARITIDVNLIGYDAPALPPRPASAAPNKRPVVVRNRGPLADRSRTRDASPQERIADLLEEQYARGGGGCSCEDRFRMDAATNTGIKPVSTTPKTPKGAATGIKPVSATPKTPKGAATAAKPKAATAAKPVVPHVAQPKAATAAPHTPHPAAPGGAHPAGAHPATPHPAGAHPAGAHAAGGHASHGRLASLAHAAHETIEGLHERHEEFGEHALHHSGAA